MSAKPGDTLFHVAFDGAADSAGSDRPWLRNLKEAFPQDRQPTIHITAQLTREEFRDMTGRDDIENAVAYLLEHYDGPGFFDREMAGRRLDDLVEAINESRPDDWPRLAPLEQQEITAEGWQAAIGIMQGIVDLDWKVQDHLVDEDFVNNNEEGIRLFTKAEPEME